MPSRSDFVVAGRGRLRALPETGRRLVEGLSWVALFFTGARAASLGAQFLAGRVLGPDEFGRMHLVMAVAASVQILPMLGFPFALSRASGEARGQGEAPPSSGPVVAAFLVWAGCCVAGLLANGRLLGPLAGLDEASWTLCVVLAAATALHLTLGGALQGAARFRERGLSEAVYGLASFTALALWLAWRPSGEALVGGYILGLAAASLHSLWRLRGSLGASSDGLNGTLPFATLGALFTVSAALIQTPGRFVLYHMESARAAGLYSAYFVATVQVALALGNMLQTVLVPLASRRDGQRDAWTMVRDWGLPAAVGLPGLFALAASAVIAIMGRSYPLEPLWVLLFALAASAVFVHYVLAAVFAARDLRGLLASVGASLGAGLLNLLLTLYLAPRFGVSGAAVALGLGHAASSAVLIFMIPGAPRPRHGP